MLLLIFMAILIIVGVIGAGLVRVIERWVSSAGSKDMMILNIVLAICVVGCLVFTLGIFNHVGNIPVLGFR
jgi:Kef-type K+ transport system membrane component KefB